MKMFQFKTGVGNYHIEFTEAPGIENSEMTNADPIAKPGTKGIFFIQIRESQPDYFIPLGVLMIIFSVACIICGFIFGFLADEIFINPAS
ncbi:MAG: hypothetical protein ABJA78_17410, partial [Ferruginibacter sp.]